MRKRIISQLALMALISGATSAYAVGPGLYFGLGFGPATNTAKHTMVLAMVPPAEPGDETVAKPQTTQFYSGAFLGYKMNQYASFEMAFNFISKIKYTTNAPPQAIPTARVRTISVLAKGQLPMGKYPFDAFVKGGVSATYLTLSGAFNSKGKNQYISKLKPAIAFGASYDINQSWVTDISYNRLMVGSVVGNVDFIALSFSYHFVDRYCGQFLCDD